VSSVWHSTLSIVRRLFAVQPLDRVRSEHDGPPLRRVLGRAGLVGIGLGTMLGGIFATIGVGTATAGPGVILSFLLSALACIFVAFCYAELAAMVPVAGSAYTYAYATLGELVAWIIGWDLILEYGISVAPTAASWSGYLQSLLSGVHLTLPVWAQTAHLSFVSGRLDVAHSQIDVIAALVVLVITAVLAAGIRESAGMNGALVVVQVIAIVAFVLGCADAVRGASFHPFLPTGLGGVNAAAALVFFAYIGFDTVTVAKEPVRDVPFGIIVSLLIGAALYCAIAVVTAGIVPWKTIDHDAGLSDVVKHVGNPPFLAIAVAVGALAGNATVMITSMLGQIRIFYVMARDRLLPDRIAAVNAKTCTPLFTTLAMGLIIAVLAATLSLDVLLRLVNIGTLSAFAIVCLGVLVMRFTKPGANRPFRAPAGPLVAMLGFGLCVLLMCGLEFATWLRFFGWMAAGLLVYAFYGYRRSLLRR
jgi:APA family basic amino acid/polyamine antiporter